MPSVSKTQHTFDDLMVSEHARIAELYIVSMISVLDDEPTSDEPLYILSDLYAEHDKRMAEIDKQIESGNREYERIIGKPIFDDLKIPFSLFCVVFAGCMLVTHII